jgi:hypothetical protein
MEDRRLTLMTMTYSLLGVWPGSSDLGASIFKIIFVKPNGSGPESSAEYSAKKQKVHATVNLVLRVLAGGAQNGEVDVCAASRVVGNLLNVSEAATRQAVLQEVSHLVARFMQPVQSKGKGTAGYDSLQLPGQVGDFLMHLTALTHEKGDKRLDMVALLGRVLQDHLLAYSGGTEARLAAPALRMVLATLPMAIAAETAREIMLNSSTAHVRAATLGALVEIATGAVFLGGKNNDAALGSALAAGGKARAAISELLVLFLAEDPVEKVRLACLDAVETLAAFFASIDNASRSREDSNPSGSATLSPSPCNALTILSALPGKVLASLVVKVGDVSLKVQARAAAILSECNGDDGNISHEENVAHGKENSAANANFASQTALVTALQSAPTRCKSEVAALILSLDRVMTNARIGEEGSEKYCPAARVLVKQLASQVELPYMPRLGTAKPRESSSSSSSSSRPKSLHLSSHKERICPASPQRTENAYEAIMFD